MGEKIGVFVCGCSENISGTVDVGGIVEESGRWPEVAAAYEHKLLCSEEGKSFVASLIAENGFDRIVIAACSPRIHESTFRKVLAEAGVNPFMLQMANIREHCAWVHTDRGEATEKALALTRAAHNRVRLHDPLERRTIPCRTDVLVVGGGPAGVEAALVLAEAGRKVYLLEKSPSIGGAVMMWEKAMPGFECASCMLDPKLQMVKDSENIELLTYSELDDLLGFNGNFTARITRRAKRVIPENCIGCGACYEPCPVETLKEFDLGRSRRKAIHMPFPGAVPNAPVIDAELCLRSKGEDCRKCEEACMFGALDYGEKDEKLEIEVGAVVVATGFSLFDPASIPNLGYGSSPDILTSLEFERLTSQHGPTGGGMVRTDGSIPKRIAMIHCVGSRDERYRNYCSGVCCAASMKAARMVTDELPDTEVVRIFRDMTVSGKGYHEFMAELDSSGRIRPVRTEDPNGAVVSARDGGFMISVKDVAGSNEVIEADMVVLFPAMIPAEGTEDLADKLSITVGSDGFFKEDHCRLETVASILEGVYVAGAAQGPKDVAGATAQGAAAAGKILSRLREGVELELEAMTAVIDEEICSGCRICIGQCPYKAIEYDGEKEISVVRDALCHACGTCVAACPSGAAAAKHFSTENILAEVGGLL